MAKITPEIIALAYQLGRKVHIEEIPHQTAVRQLEARGVNKTSASFSISILRQMLSGTAYRRAMSVGQTRFFITAIYSDDGLDGLKKAIAAFAGHLPFLRKSSNNKMPGLTALLAEFEKLAASPATNKDAINDLDEGAEGPKLVTRLVSGFVRNSLVRAAVRKRAAGKCEFCRKPGFMLPDGSRYVETHHVISLARQGPDTVRNVIGLCADHHREAHFGSASAPLERKFVEILDAIAHGSQLR